MTKGRNETKVTLAEIKKDIEYIGKELNDFKEENNNAHNKLFDKLDKGSGKIAMHGSKIEILEQNQKKFASKDWVKAFFAVSALAGILSVAGLLIKFI